jgi:hypothetical protein
MCNESQCSVAVLDRISKDYDKEKSRVAKDRVFIPSLGTNEHSLPLAGPEYVSVFYPMMRRCGALWMSAPVDCELNIHSDMAILNFTTPLPMPSLRSFVAPDFWWARLTWP